MPKLTLKKRAVFNPREISFQRKRVIAQPTMWQFAIEINPHIKPPHRRHRTMAMPFTWPIQAGLPCPNLLPALLRINFPATARDEPKTKFPQHTPLAPFELIVGRMAGARIRLMWPDVFPSRVRQI